MCADWTRDVFDIAASRFGDPLVIDDDAAYYVYVYSKGPPPEIDGAGGVAARTKVRTIEFELSNRRTVSWFVSGDVVLRTRVQHWVDAAASEPPPFRIPPTASDSVRASETALLERVRERFVRGRPSVLDPG